MSNLTFGAILALVVVGTVGATWAPPDTRTWLPPGKEHYEMQAGWCEVFSPSTDAPTYVPVMELEWLDGRWVATLSSGLMLSTNARCGEMWGPR